MANPYLFRCRLALPIVLLVSPVVFAQSEKPNPPQPSTSPAKSGTRTSKAETAANKSKIDQQRALALSLLVSLSNDARNYQDQRLRARTLSRIADALWEPDPDQGRALFRRAWDAAAVADQDSLRKLEEDRKRQEAAGGPIGLTMPPDLRSEVLRLAARRDRALGEELLDKLAEARKQETAEAVAPSRYDSIATTPEVIRQRIRLARQLLDTDVERALQFADPALTSVTMEALSFLTALREKNPSAADERYARQLAIAEADLLSDANTISLLSSYLFTPHLFVQFSRTGGQNSSQMNQRVPPPDVAPQLRNAFFRTASSVLLRPLLNKEQDRSTSGIQGKYMVIRRLMPFFEKYAPKEMADSVRNEMTALAQSSGRNERDYPEDDDPISRGIGPERDSKDIEKSLLDRIERAKTSDERDGLYLQLAILTANKGDLRTRDFTDKIEEMDLRNQAKAYVDMMLGLTLVEKKDHEKALFVADKGELTPIQKVWLLTEAAKAMPPTEKEKALEVIDQAATAARRIGGTEADRPRALLAVANAYVVVDKARAWEMMLEVVKASNSAEGFTGEDGRLVLQLRSKYQTSMRTSTEDDFNLAGIFQSLARENATQSVEIARSFETEGPRASALIAVARALLSEKPKA